jgi:hypothetical protein
MKRQIALVLAVVFSTVYFGIAQVVPTVTAEISFSFIAQGKVLPAGTYSIKEVQGGNQLVVTNTKTNETVFANVITRLGSEADQQSDLVFDAAGNSRYLSEVHMAGSDGYLVNSTPEKHTHVHVKAKK